MKTCIVSPLSCLVEGMKADRLECLVVWFSLIGCISCLTRRSMVFSPITAHIRKKLLWQFIGISTTVHFYTSAQFSRVVFSLLISVLIGIMHAVWRTQPSLKPWCVLVSGGPHTPSGQGETSQARHPTAYCLWRMLITGHGQWVVLLCCCCSKLCTVWGRTMLFLWRIRT